MEKYNNLEEVIFVLSGRYTELVEDVYKYEDGELVGLDVINSAITHFDKVNASIDLLGEVELKTQYLSSTDWYYARKVETGEEVPEYVAIKRTEAREFIRSQEDY